MDVLGKLLDVGDRVLVIAPSFWFEERKVSEIRGVVFSVGYIRENYYEVYLDGPVEEGWEGWGSKKVVVPGNDLMRYEHNWSYT